jgi:hypothetical protein
MTKGSDKVYPSITDRGLTKRELFAAMSMQGVMIGQDYKKVDSSDKVALWAVFQADALIKALNDKP